MALTPWNRQEEWYQEMIDAIGEGGALPPITSADAGKVLSVNSNGEWDAESNLFVVTVTLNQSYMNVADKTYNEILAAVDAGKEVVCDKDGVRFSYSGHSNGIISFTQDTILSLSSTIKITSANDVSVFNNYFLPKVTRNEAGKVLSVNNGGSWQAQNPKFVVTLTPTEQDFSGEMDKTAQQITDAYNAGQEIEFDIPSLSVKCKAMEFAVYNGLINAGAIVTYRTGGSHMLIEILTSASSADAYMYGTTIYTLTPAT